MPKTRYFTPILLLSASLAVCGGAEKPGPERALSRLPAVVQKTIHEQVGSGKLLSLEKNVDDGEVTFDLQMIRDSKTRDFTVSGNGELVSVQVFLTELPAAVQKTIQSQIAKGKLVGIDKQIDGDDATYDVELTRDGKTRSLTVGENGELLSEEVFLLELPDAVQKAVQDRIGSGTLVGIEKTVDAGQAAYDVDLTRDGKDRSFTIGSDGQLQEEQFFLSELPAALQTAIQTKATGGKLGEINKSIDDGQVSYDVDVIQSGKTRILTFDADGNLSSEQEEISLNDAPEAVRKEIQSLAGDARISELSRITEGKEISYDLELKQGGKGKLFSIGADGKLLSSNDGNQP